MSMTQMAREIAEQPVALGRTLDALIPLRPKLTQLAAGRRRVLFAARGTSDHAAIYGRYLLETHAGILGGLLSPSVATHYRSRLDLADCVVVCVSQSGETAEIVESEAWARGCGAVTVAVTNVAGSPLADNAGLALVTEAGPELAVPATKSHTTQLAAMAVIGTALAPEPEALDDDLARIPAEVQRLLETDVADAVAALRIADHTVVSGRGLMLGSALETALKLEETCLRPVRGYSYADFRHGPIAVVTSGVTAILLAAPDGPLLAPMTELAGDLSSRGAVTVGIGGDGEFAKACTTHLPGPDVPEPLAPLGAIVPAQVLVEQLTRALGLDPDSPRGLSKVATTDPRRAAPSGPFS
jgi:glucosamine--fructose-6-phosphate aminotransferase (isomerizing)